jgi:fused signal recognition particle receptor
VLLQEVVPTPNLTIPAVPPPVGMPSWVWMVAAAAAVFLLAAILLWVARRRRRAAPPPKPLEPPRREVLEEHERVKVEIAEPDPSRRAILEGIPREPAVAKPHTLEEGLGRTREGFVGRIRTLVAGRTIDESVVDDLEEVLFTADLGVKTAGELLEELRKKVGRKEAGDPAALQEILKHEIRTRLGDGVAPLDFSNGHARPYVIMVVGVNGVGKTTTIGKLAKQISDRGKKVLLGAGDTFRAAAAEQLEIWASRVGCDIVSNKEGTDPSAVAFDAAKAALARNADVLLLDTAGRLHTKQNLMEELKKVKRVVGREIPGAPHEVLLVVDATTGQNALNQAKEFHAGVGVTGIVLTKLDGTAKGGIVVGIRDEMKLPVRYIGIGEGVEDLRPFDPDAFVEALFA